MTDNCLPIYVDKRSRDRMISHIQAKSSPWPLSLKDRASPSAVQVEGYTATGIEVTDEYARLARERIAQELAQAA